MSEEIRKKASLKMKAIWATKEGQAAAEKLSAAAKDRIADIYADCMNKNLTEMGYTSAAECLRQEAEDAGLGDAIEDLYY